jgi:hypothetical protein
VNGDPQLRRSPFVESWGRVRLRSECRSASVAADVFRLHKNSRCIATVLELVPLSITAARSRRRGTWDGAGCVEAAPDRTRIDPVRLVGQTFQNGRLNVNSFASTAFVAIFEYSLAPLRS